MQINSLLAQIHALQERIAALNGATPATGAHLSCLVLTHNFGPNDTDATTNGEVSKLQRFLTADPSFYPEASVTGYFGPATTRALQRYQARNGIVSSGDPQLHRLRFRRSQDARIRDARMHSDPSPTSELVTRFDQSFSPLECVRASAWTRSLPVAYEARPSVNSAA